jgi:selenocysteine-specific elongation factor
VGLAGPERAALHRGQWLVADGVPWGASRALDVALTLDPAAPRPLAPKTRVRVLLGTAEVLGRVRADAAVEPGSTGFVRLALEEPLVARGGDRFVLRSYSPVATIGGGRVLDPLPPLRGPRPDATLAAHDPAERLVVLIERRQSGVERGRIPILLGVGPDEAQRIVAAERRLQPIGQRVTLRSRVEAVQADAVERVRVHHRAAPTERGMSVETLRRSLRAPAWVADAAIEALAAGRRLVVAGSVAALPGFLPKALAADADVDAIVERLTQAGLAPPTVGELEQTLGRSDVAILLRAAAAAGKVEAVERDRFYVRAALDRIVSVLRTLDASGDITPAALRDALGTSRKFVVPLLEWADRRGYTLREGEARRINRRMFADATPGAESSA